MYYSKIAEALGNINVDGAFRPYATTIYNEIGELACVVEKELNRETNRQIYDILVSHGYRPYWKDVIEKLNKQLQFNTVRGHTICLMAYIGKKHDVIHLLEEITRDYIEIQLTHRELVDLVNLIESIKTPEITADYSVHLKGIQDKIIYAMENWGLPREEKL